MIAYFTAGSLRNSLMADRHAKLNVCPDFPSVGGAVEAAEFHRSLGKHRVEVQHAVAGIGVMDAAFVVAVVPDALELGTGGRLGYVQALHEILIGLFAVVHAGGFDAQRMHRRKPHGRIIRDHHARRGIGHGVVQHTARVPVFCQRLQGAPHPVTNGYTSSPPKKSY